eukprot:11822037-Prorocentrum_lima.AAC.1
MNAPPSPMVVDSIGDECSATLVQGLAPVTPQLEGSSSAADSMQVDQAGVGGPPAPLDPPPSRHGWPVELA